MTVKPLLGVLVAIDIKDITDLEKWDRWLQVGPQILIFFGLILLFLEIRALRADLIRVFERLSQRM